MRVVRVRGRESERQQDPEGQGVPEHRKLGETSRRRPRAIPILWDNPSRLVAERRGRVAWRRVSICDAGTRVTKRLISINCRRNIITRAVVYLKYPVVAPIPICVRRKRTHFRLKLKRASGTRRVPKIVSARTITLKLSSPRGAEKSVVYRYRTLATNIYNLSD